ncbi:hypothetical protein NL676_038626 [Syzygium grande]|nr:hypothetical protein NL676_038626 [Syzygium grande]
MKPSSSPSRPGFSLALRIRAPLSSWATTRLTAGLSLTTNPGRSASGRPGLVAWGGRWCPPGAAMVSLWSRGALGRPSTGESGGPIAGGPPPPVSLGLVDGWRAHLRLLSLPTPFLIE